MAAGRSRFWWGLAVIGTVLAAVVVVTLAFGQFGIGGPSAEAPSDHASTANAASPSAPQRAGAQDPSAPAESDSPTVLTLPADDPDLSLGAAVGAAQLHWCEECVVLDGGAAQRDSAERGIVDLSIMDPTGGGFVEAWGFTGTKWMPLHGGQEVERVPTWLPDRIWICTGGLSTNVRSGPSPDYPVITVIDQDTVVDAKFFRLTKPQTEDSDGEEIDGEGWFEIDDAGARGWVSSSRVASDEGCEFWGRFFA